MLKDWIGKEAAIHFIDGTKTEGGVLEEANDKFLRYRSEYQMMLIPMSAVRSITVDIKERQRSKVGFV